MSLPRKKLARTSPSRTFRTAIENLEGRQLMTVITGTDVKTLLAGDGSKNNGNDVVVKFDKAIKSVDASKIRMFGYANNTLQGGQSKETIDIASATFSGSTITLRTTAQVRKGAQITLNSGAVVDTANAGVTGTVRTAKGLNRDRFTLALRAFAPTNKQFFSSAVITGGRAPVTANTEPSSASVRTAFSTFLDRKVTAKTITSAQRTSTLARFDNDDVEDKVPSANLRAAILSLVGTVGAPAIAHYLDGANATGRDFNTIAIGGSNFSGPLPVAVTSYTSTGRLKFNLNPNYAGESFVVLSGRMAHEAMHEGLEEFGTSTDENQINSQDEEVVSNFVETVIYAQQTSLLFDYARTGTTLTLQNNYRLLALLNSGDRQFPRVGIKNAPLTNSDGVFPGMTPYFDDTPNTKIRSFEEDVREEFIARNVGDKPGTQTFATARAILKNITGTTYTSTQKFDDALIAGIDVGQDTFGDRFAMTAARVIQVTV